LALLAAACGFGLLALAGRVGPAKAQDGLWHPSTEGLYGDRVADLAFVGLPGISGYSMALLPRGRGLYRNAGTLLEWQSLAVAPERPRDAVLTVHRDWGQENGRRLYVGLRGRPLLARSEDRGDSWTSLAGPVGPGRFDLLTASTSISGTVYAAEAGGRTLWISRTRGDSWQGVAVPSASGGAEALFAAPDDPMVYLVANGTLYRTPDDPGQWIAVLGPSTTPAMTVRLADVGPRGRLYAVGEAGGRTTLLVSTNRGDTWPTGGWPAEPHVLPRVMAAGEVSPGLNGVWLGFENGRIHESPDGGTTWDAIGEVPITPTHLAVDPSNGAVWVGTDGLGLFRVNRSPLHTGAVPLDALAAVAPTYTSDGLVLLHTRVLPERRDTTGATKPPLYALMESNGGEIWTRRVMTDVLGTNLLASPAFATDRRLYSGRMISRDAGHSWLPLPNVPGSSTPPYVVTVGPITGTLPVLYALREPYVTGQGDGSGLFLSEDGGFSWQATDVSITGIVAVVVSPSYAEERRAYFGTDRGRIFETIDGVSFAQVGQIPSVAPERILYDLAISPNFRNDTILLASAEQPSSPQRAHMYISTSAGEIWQDQSVGLAERARSRTLSLSPDFGSDRVVFLGTERRETDPLLAGIFSTESAGREWFGEVTLPPAQVNGFGWGGTIPDGRLFAAAGEAGLWWRNLVEPPGSGLPTASPTSPGPTASPTATGAASATPTAPGPTPTATSTPEPGTSATATTPAGATATATTAVGGTATASATPSATATAGSGTPATATPTATGVPTEASVQPPAPVIFLPFGLKSRPPSTRR
jgi:photosystem II stability/assembly factor-like uncharacterized protein